MDSADVDIAHWTRSASQLEDKLAHYYCLWCFGGHH